MTKPVFALLGNSIRSWLSAKGFVLVAAASLLPLILTGAWVVTHRGDIALDNLEFNKDSLVNGQVIDFSTTVTNVGSTTVSEFNVTFQIGTVDPNTFTLRPDLSTTQKVEGLASGESKTLTFNWTATRPGLVFAVAVADNEDNIGEENELNNQFDVPMIIKNAEPAADTAPKAPSGVGGDENATLVADLGVSNLEPAGVSILPGAPQTFNVTVTNNGPAPVTNAVAVIRVGSTTGPAFFEQANTTENVTLGLGESKIVSVTWTPFSGSFWAEAWVTPPADVKDSTTNDNHATASFTADTRLPDQIDRPKPVEKQTIKEFYLGVLSLLHIRLLLPLVALFYAAGTVADARENASLRYILTKPVPRWLLPLTKFVSSFVVAAIATVIGIVLTYFMLFQSTPQGGDVGFLTTPLLVSLLTLFAYGAVFTLIGVTFERPYLVGIGFLLGWENAAPLLLPWVQNLTISHHLAVALSGAGTGPGDGWFLDQGLQWLPQGAAALQAFWILLVIGVAGLALAATTMKRREYEV